MLVFRPDRGLARSAGGDDQSGRPACGVEGGAIAAMVSGAADELARMRAAEQFGFRGRWLLLSASGVLLIAWPPRDRLPVAAVALLAVYNLAGWLILPRLTTVGRARAGGLASLALL